MQKQVRTAALTCYRAFKCAVYARVDMLLKDGIPYVLEVNTLPGMTATSLLPQSAAAAGMDFSSLLDEIITGSLRERGELHNAFGGERGWLWMQGLSCRGKSRKRSKPIMAIIPILLILLIMSLKRRL